MQKDELVLSDVHIQINSCPSQKHHVSRFYFSEDGIDAKRKVEQRDVTSSGITGIVETEGSNQISEHKFMNANFDRDIQKRNDFKKKYTGKSQSGCDLELVNSGNLKSKDYNLEKFNNDCMDKYEELDNVDIKTYYREVQYDEDGDCNIRRKKRKWEYLSAITIVHKKETILQNVGQQVWLASLYMSDFIISKREKFIGKRVLELGAGVGLTSIIAAKYADNVICTDIGKDVLELAKYNFDNNIIENTNNYRIVELDWFHNRYSTEAKLCDKVTTESCDNKTTDSYDNVIAESCDNVIAKSCDNVTAEWCSIKNINESCDDVLAEQCDIIISADVIYDDDATDALFRTVYGIMKRSKTHIWFIAIEKRYVFTLKDLDIACPAYQHFRENLTQLECIEGFTVSRVADFPQCFQYSRTKELELWKVSRAQDEKEDTCVEKN